MLLGAAWPSAPDRRSDARFGGDVHELLPPRLSGEITKQVIAPHSGYEEIWEAVIVDVADCHAHTARKRRLDRLGETWMRLRSAPFPRL